MALGCIMAWGECAPGLGMKSTWCNNGWSGERVEPRQIARAARETGERERDCAHSAELLSAAFDSQKPHHGTFITRIKRLFLDFLLSLCFYIMWSIKFLFSTNQIQESCLRSLYQFLSSSSRTLPAARWCACCVQNLSPSRRHPPASPPARASSTP
jgi:hypothetical protein